MDFQEDQRIFDRFTARFPAKFEDSRDDFDSEISLRDMSAQGARLVTHQRLRVNDSVSVQIKLPDGHAQLNLNGQIVWVKNQGFNVWEIGLKFNKVSFMALQRLFQFCQ